MSGAALGDQLSFDVAVADGATSVGWNDAGATGTLTLVEPLSFTDVAEAATAPVIDGDTDAVWGTADSVSTDKEIQGVDGASAVVRTLWKDNTLYVLAEVTDPILDDTGSDPWTEDSVEIYVDAGNAKNGSYRFDDTQIRINYNNVTSFGSRRRSLPGQPARERHEGRRRRLRRRGLDQPARGRRSRHASTASTSR